jgi:hypothetical protein
VPEPGHMGFVVDKAALGQGFLQVLRFPLPNIPRHVRLVFLRSVLRLLVAACVVPSSPIFVTLMLEIIRSSETSILTRATRRNIPRDGIFHSPRRENLKSYIALTGCAL